MINNLLAVKQGDLSPISGKSCGPLFLRPPVGVTPGRTNPPSRPCGGDLASGFFSPGLLLPKFQGFFLFLKKKKNFDAPPGKPRRLWGFATGAPVPGRHLRGPLRLFLHGVICPSYFFLLFTFRQGHFPQVFGGSYGALKVPPLRAY